MQLDVLHERGRVHIVRLGLVPALLIGDGLLLHKWEFHVVREQHVQLPEPEPGRRQRRLLRLLPLDGQLLGRLLRVLLGDGHVLKREQHLHLQRQ